MWLKLHYHLKRIWALLHQAKAVKEAPLFIAAVFKNESLFLKEWVDFHLRQGVERIYLADNFSSDQGELVLKPYLDSGQVRLQKTRSKGMNARIQAAELNYLLNTISEQEGDESWVAIIDIDEFLFAPEGEPITRVLARFKSLKIGAVLINWMMFGTSNLKNLNPEKSMLEQLTMRAHVSLGEHKMVKPILYLANSLGFLEGPHIPFSKGKAQLIHADGSQYQFKDPQIIHTPLRINHYWYRSQAYYDGEKRIKRRAFGDERSGKREEDHIRACNYEEDYSILKLR